MTASDSVFTFTKFKKGSPQVETPVGAAASKVIHNPSKSSSFDPDEVFVLFEQSSVVIELEPGDEVEFTATKMTNPVNTKLVTGWHI